MTEHLITVIGSQMKATNDKQLKRIHENLQKKKGIEPLPPLVKEGSASSSQLKKESKKEICSRCRKVFSNEAIITDVIYGTCVKCRRELEEERKQKLAMEEKMKRKWEEEEIEKFYTLFDENPGDILSRCNTPPHYYWAALDNCPDLPANMVKKMYEWAETPESMFFFSGSPGGGKTWLSVAILREIIKHEYPIFKLQTFGNCHYINERDYLEYKRDGFGRGNQPLLRIEDKSFLIIDDICSTRLTDWGKGEIAGLIEHRYDRNLPTIITSNLNKKQIAKTLDARIASRIAESGLSIKFPSNDLRQTGTATRNLDGFQSMGAE